MGVVTFVFSITALSNIVSYEAIQYLQLSAEQEAKYSRVSACIDQYAQHNLVSASASHVCSCLFYIGHMYIHLFCWLLATHCAYHIYSLFKGRL